MLSVVMLNVVAPIYSTGHSLLVFYANVPNSEEKSFVLN